MLSWVASKWGVVVRGLELHRIPPVEQVVHTVGGVVSGEVRFGGVS